MIRTFYIELYKTNITSKLFKFNIKLVSLKYQPLSISKLCQKLCRILFIKTRQSHGEPAGHDTACPDQLVVVCSLQHESGFSPFLQKLVKESWIHLRFFSLDTSIRTGWRYVFLSVYFYLHWFYCGTFLCLLLNFKY